MSDDEFQRILNDFAWSIGNIKDSADLAKIVSAITQIVLARIESADFFEKARNLMTSAVWHPTKRN